MLLYGLILILITSSLFLLLNTFLFRLQQSGRTITGILVPPQEKKLSISALKIPKFMEPLIRPISGLPYIRTLAQEVKALRINLDIATLILLKIALMIIGGISVSVLFKPLYGLMALVAGFFLPDLIFINKIKAKREQIIRVFPETIDLMDLCIGAGLDFSTAIHWIINMTEPNAFMEQLEVVLGEIRVGKSRTEALKDMAKRLKIPDVSSFVRTVVQAERMGTSVEEAFKNLSEDTRMARFNAGERYAIKASLKILIPLLFFILPVIMIVVAGPIIVQFTQGGLFPGAAP